MLHVYEIIKAVAVEMPANEILKASKDKDLDLFHEDMEVHTCLDKSVPHIGAPTVWKEMKNKGEGMIVAVVDTGVDGEHPDLNGKLIGKNGVFQLGTVKCVFTSRKEHDAKQD